jgi:hypothetical protein
VASVGKQPDARSMLTSTKVWRIVACLQIPASWTRAEALDIVSATCEDVYMWNQNPKGMKVYTISAGQAHFVITGHTGDDDWALIPADNSTESTVTELAGEWSFETFDIGYVDDSSETWTVTINASEWLEE